MSTDYATKLKRIVFSVRNETENICNFSNTYFKSFSEAVRSGIPTFSSDAGKLAAEYFLFISSASNALSGIDTAISGISEIIVEADMNYDSEAIAACDKLLSGYGDLRTAVRNFAERNDKDISAKRFSEATALRYLNELNYKINYFLRLLDALNT